jgi:hypothetical protein
VSDSTGVVVLAGVAIVALLVLLVVDRPRCRGRHRSGDVSASGGWRLREIRPRRRCWQGRRSP